MTSSESNF